MHLEAVRVRSLEIVDRFLDAATRIALEHDGEAARLLELADSRSHPDLKGSRANMWARVRESLTAAGHLDERDPLDEAEIVVRTLTEVGTRLDAGDLQRTDIRTLVRTLVGERAPSNSATLDG